MHSPRLRQRRQHQHLSVAPHAVAASLQLRLPNANVPHPIPWFFLVNEQAEQKPVTPAGVAAMGVVTAGVAGMAARAGVGGGRARNTTLSNAEHKNKLSVEFDSAYPSSTINQVPIPPFSSLASEGQSFGRTLARTSSSCLSSRLPCRQPSLLKCCPKYACNPLSPRWLTLQGRQAVGRAAGTAER